MTNEEINMEVEEQTTFAEGEDLSGDDFVKGNNSFLKSPAVGDSIEFELVGIKKMPAKKVKNPTTGKSIDIGLSSVDYYFDFLTRDKEVFSVTSWQIVGKTKAILKKLGGKYGMMLKIEHCVDGRTAAKDTEAWKVYAFVEDGFKELDRESEEWK